MKYLRIGRKIIYYITVASLALCVLLFIIGFIIGKTCNVYQGATTLMISYLIMSTVFVPGVFSWISLHLIEQLFKEESKVVKSED